MPKPLQSNSLLPNEIPHAPQEALQVNANIPGGDAKLVAELESIANPIPTEASPAKAPTGNTPELSVTENTAAAQVGDSQIWKVSLAITNFSKPVKPVFIPGNYMFDLVVEHSILDPCFYKGSVIITSNRFGILEGKSPDDNLNLEMLFRGDGKDEILIEILPLFGDSVELPPETWNIKSQFIVYDTEDIPWKDGQSMAKKVYFWHKAYALMQERGAPFSTAKHTGITNIKNATNEERMIPTGQAIRNLLEDSNLAQYIDYDEWDDGSPNSKLFYNSAPGSKVQDSIDDLIGSYISKDGGPGLLYFNRGKDKFQLMGLKKFFENAGTSDPGMFYYETFTLGTGDSGIEETNISPRKTPIINTSKFDHAFVLKKYNIIKDNGYTLTDASGADSLQSGISRMMHTYNHKYKIFSTSYEASEVKNHRKYFKKNFTDKLLPGKKGFPLIVLNSAKKSQSRVAQNYLPASRYSFSGTPECIISKVGRNYMTLSSIFLNLGINFTSQGSTHRHPGRFIGIDKNKQSDNKFDYRMLGQWFVTSVSTRWKDNMLLNEIVANKVSSFGDLRFNEDV